MHREVPDPHRLPDRRLHFGIRVSLGQHPKGATVVGAPKAVAHVQPRLGVQLAVVKRGKNTKEYREFDGAGGVEPPIRAVAKLESAIGIMDRDRDCAAARSLLKLQELISQGAWRSEPGRRGGDHRHGGLNEVAM